MKSTLFKNLKGKSLSFNLPHNRSKLEEFYKNEKK